MLYILFPWSISVPQQPPHPDRRPGVHEHPLHAPLHPGVYPKDCRLRLDGKQRTVQYGTAVVTLLLI